MNFKWLIAALIFVVSLPVAQATPISSGTGELVGFHPCIAGATSACDSFGTTGPAVAHVYAGLPGNTSSSTGPVTLGVLGSGIGSASLGTAGSDGAPILKGAASAASGERVVSNVAALQSYTWNGQGPATRTFGGTLTYSQTVTGVYPPLIGAGIDAEIDIFTLSTPSIEAGTTAQDNFAALGNGGYGLPGYTDLGSADFDDPATNPDGMGTLTDTITLTPGQTIWVWAFLQAVATNGGNVDAADTFVTSWDNTTGLTPAAVASAPEPATPALLLAGLIGCAIALRRRKRTLAP